MKDSRKLNTSGYAEGKKTHRMYNGIVATVDRIYSGGSYSVTGLFNGSPSSNSSAGYWLTSSRTGENQIEIDFSAYSGDFKLDGLKIASFCANDRKASSYAIYVYTKDGKSSYATHNITSTENSLGYFVPFTISARRVSKIVILIWSDSSTRWGAALNEIEIYGGEDTSRCLALKANGKVYYFSKAGTLKDFNQSVVETDGSRAYTISSKTDSTKKISSLDVCKKQGAKKVKI